MARRTLTGTITMEQIEAFYLQREQEQQTAALTRSYYLMYRREVHAELLLQNPGM